MNLLPIWEAEPLLKLASQSRYVKRENSLPRSPTRLHSHPFFELGMVLCGRCQWSLGEPHRKRTLEAGQAILVRPGLLHYEIPDSSLHTELAWIGFQFVFAPPKWMGKAIPLREDFDEIATSFQRIFREHTSNDKRTRLHVRLAVQNILLLVSRQAENRGTGKIPSKISGREESTSGLNAHQIRSIQSAAYYFRQNFQEPLTIAQVAAYNSLCPAYFSTLFRQHYGEPPRRYLQQIRVEKAVELLIQSDLTVKEIAAQCGFVDAAHLNKVFHQRRGFSPGAFRKRYG